MADASTKLPGPRPRRIPPGHVSLGIEPKHLCVGLCYRPYSQWHSPECSDGGRAGASEVRAWNDSNTGWSHTLTATKQPSTTARALCTCRRDRCCCGQKGDLSPENPEMLSGWLPKSETVQLQNSSSVFPAENITFRFSPATSRRSNNGWGPAIALTGGGRCRERWPQKPGSSSPPDGQRDNSQSDCV